MDNFVDVLGGFAAVAVLVTGLHEKFVEAVARDSDTHWISRTVAPMITWMIIAILIGLLLHAAHIVQWRV